jgi:hypothetical protein
VKTVVFFFCSVFVINPQVSSAQTQSNAQQTNTRASSNLPRGYTSRNGNLYLSIPLGTSTASSSVHAFFDASVPGNQCATIPQATDATMTDDNLYSMSGDVAASLKIQVPIGAGAASGTSNENKLMRQYKRYATCTTPNRDVLE